MASFQKSNIYNLKVISYSSKFLHLKLYIIHSMTYTVSVREQGEITNTPQEKHWPLTFDDTHLVVGVLVLLVARLPGNGICQVLDQAVRHQPPAIVLYPLVPAILIWNEPSLKFITGNNCGDDLCLKGDLQIWLLLCLYHLSSFC